MRPKILLCVLAIAGVACAQGLSEFGAAAAGGTTGGAAGKSVSDGITKVFGKVNQRTASAADKQPGAAKAEPLLQVGPGVPQSKSVIKPAPAPEAHAATTHSGRRSASERAKAKSPKAKSASAKPVRASNAQAVVPPPPSRGHEAVRASNDQAIVPPPPPREHEAVHVAERSASERRPEPVEAAPPPPSPAPPPHVTEQELARLSVGMKRDQVLALGPPSSRVTMFADGHLVEVYSYVTGDATLGTVRLSDGTVSSVSLP
jgi:hypothetical protein